MTTVLDKLRFKPGMRVCVLDAPAGFQAELASLPTSVERAKALRGELDLVHVFVTRLAQLTPRLSKVKGALKAGGILWVSYPKADGLSTDLNRDVLRRALAKRGLQAVANVAVDEVWSAVRFKKC